MFQFPHAASSATLPTASLLPADVIALDHSERLMATYTEWHSSPWVSRESREHWCLIGNTTLDTNQPTTREERGRRESPVSRTLTAHPCRYARHLHSPHPKTHSPWLLGACSCSGMHKSYQRHPSIPRSQPSGSATVPRPLFSKHSVLSQSLHRGAAVMDQSCRHARLLEHHAWRLARAGWLPAFRRRSVPVEDWGPPVTEPPLRLASALWLLL